MQIQFQNLMICEEYTASLGKNIHFCNTIKNKIPVLCQDLYHKEWIKQNNVCDN